MVEVAGRRDPTSSPARPALSPTSYHSTSFIFLNLLPGIMEWKDFERLLFLAMAPVQSVAILSVGAFSLATDGAEETVSRLIHVVNFQDLTITLVLDAEMGRRKRQLPLVHVGQGLSHS